MTFIQLIETTTTRRDEMDALAERWRSLTEGRRTARRSTATHDQDLCVPKTSSTSCDQAVFVDQATKACFRTR
jgi:hypothetical protein